MGRLSDAQRSGTGGDIPPGETRTILAKDKQGNILKTMTLFRTERPYVFDLCDCYNAARTQSAIDRGVEWYVNSAGELKIGDSNAWARSNTRRIESRNETERAQHNRRQLEAARAANAYLPEDA